MALNFHKLDTGTKISGIGHVGLILWLLFGGLLSSDDLPPLEVAEVSLISGDEFAALMTAVPDETAESTAPSAPEEAPQSPEAPTETEAATPPAAQTPPETTETPPPTPEPVQPDPTPEPIAPTPPAEVTEIAPPTPESPTVEPLTDPAPVIDSSPRPVPRVAPEATPEPSPEAAIDDIVQQEAAPVAEPEAEVVEEAQEETAPQAATTEIVTEAEETPEPLAPTQSRRPTARPNRPAPVAEAAPETPTPPAQSDPSPAVEADAVDAALAAALAGASTSVANSEPSAAPAGPPLTAGEQNTLVAQISQCWNVGSLSTDGLLTTVVVAMEMTAEAKPVAGSIRMVSSEGGTSVSVSQAYEAARRAIIRCGAKGFDLPSDKYEHWREIEMVFNPEKMRFK